MDIDEKSIINEAQLVSAKLVIVQGVVQNLPVIVDAILNKRQPNSALYFPAFGDNC